jgi:hypothetical protein
MAELHLFVSHTTCSSHAFVICIYTNITFFLHGNYLRTMLGLAVWKWSRSMVVINTWNMCHSWHIVTLKMAHEYFASQNIFLI